MEITGGNYKSLIFKKLHFQSTGKSLKVHFQLGKFTFSIREITESTFSTKEITESTFSGNHESTFSTREITESTYSN